MKNDKQLVAILHSYFTQSQYVDRLQDGFIFQYCRDCGRQSTEAHNWNCPRKLVIDSLAAILDGES